MSQFKIISEAIVGSSFPTRAGKQDVYVLYQLGDDTGKFDPTRTFQVFVPAEDAYDVTAKQIREAVVDQAIRENEARRQPANPRTGRL